MNTRLGALSFESEIRQRLLRGVSAPLHDHLQLTTPTFRAFAEYWLATDVATNNRPNTHRCKRSVVRVHLDPAFGTLPLDHITEANIDDYASQKISAGYNRGTVRRHLIILRRCLHVAKRRGILASVPKIQLPQPAPGRQDYLHPDDVSRLLTDAHAPRWNAMVRVALRTGMRVGELLGLRWEDVDLDHHIVTVRRTYSGGFLSEPKTGNARHIPLTDDVVNALRALPQGGRYVFSSFPDHPHSRNAAAAALTAIAKRTNVRPHQPFSWHVLRHTFATAALWNGADIRSVQSVLGHASIEMTARYSHVSTESLRNAVARAAYLVPRSPAAPSSSR